MKKSVFPKLFSILSLFFFISLYFGQLSAQSNRENMTIELAGFQMSVSNDIRTNQEKIIEAIRKAANDGARFLITPEGSLSGYTSNFNQADLALALENITAFAKKMKVGLMLGTCYKENIKGKEYCYNQVRVYLPNGDFLGDYSKILRCSSLDLPGSGEMVDYVEGELNIFNWNGVRFGILICNDLWATPGYTTMPNPYLPWKLRQMGAQFIIHCINSGTVQKYRPFHESSAELWASSLKIPIIEVNAAQGNETINAQSGLIESDGVRKIRIKDSGEHYFTIRLNTETLEPQKKKNGG
jgi:predicted amidohydrolase